MSQSCGSCSRGIAGAGIPIPAPDHLKKYLNNYCCQSCGTKENNIQLSEIKHYEESTFIYCLGKNDPSEICNKNIIGFTCKKDNDLIYICYD